MSQTLRSKAKAVVVVDFAYKGPKRTGRGTGYQGLRATLKYLQFRDRENNQRAGRGIERWRDRGLGLHWRDILSRSGGLQSKHVLAWTWVVSPAPDLMALVPERDRWALLAELTERVVEDYYAARGFEMPEYSYILHDREGRSEAGVPVQHLHTHVILPGTAPLGLGERTPVYNNADRGHDRLFREIATRHFEAALDLHLGPEWRQHREPESGPRLER